MSTNVNAGSIIDFCLYQDTHTRIYYILMWSYSKYKSIACYFRIQQLKLEQSHGCSIFENADQSGYTQNLFKYPKIPEAITLQLPAAEISTLDIFSSCRAYLFCRNVSQSFGKLPNMEFQYIVVSGRKFRRPLGERVAIISNGLFGNKQAISFELKLAD